MLRVIVALAVVLVLATAWFLLRSPSRRSPGRGTTHDTPCQPTTSRMDYQTSCARLAQLDLLPPNSVPPIPDHRPRHDDEEPLGVSFFRTELADADLANVSLPRTLFGRSEIRNTSFRNADLSESTLCWNDFIRVDFTGANLSACDLRASQYLSVTFENADLSGSDLRSTYFEDCRFAGAQLTGAKLTTATASQLNLGPTQLSSVDWQSTEGEEPGGG